MKNNVKNALNALGLLGFMALAWATKFEPVEEPIKMSLTFNTDSTAFVLNNLENTDFNNGFVTINRKIDSTRLDNNAVFFFQDSVSIKALATINLPFGKIKGTAQTGVVDTFSKRFSPARFNYSVFLRGKGRNQVNGNFEFNF
jgi:hypothetical protein